MHVTRGFLFPGTEFVDPTSNLVMDMYRAEEKKARELIQSLRQRLKDAGVRGLGWRGRTGARWRRFESDFPVSGLGF